MMDCEPRETAQYKPHESYYYEGSGLGPEGLRDYRAQLTEHSHAVGIGEVSKEQTLDSAYLLRPAPGATLDRPRSCRPGEIGWGIPWLTDWSASLSGQQIVLGDFRQIAEDRSTHEKTGAWYPHPEQQTPPGSDGYYKENIYSGRPASKGRDLTSLTPTQPDPTQGVCPEPVDNRPPFRSFLLSSSMIAKTSGAQQDLSVEQPGDVGVGRGGRPEAGCYVGESRGVGANLVDCDGCVCGVGATLELPKASRGSCA